MNDRNRRKVIFIVMMIVAAACMYGLRMQGDERNFSPKSLRAVESFADQVERQFKRTISADGSTYKFVVNKLDPSSLLAYQYVGLQRVVKASTESAVEGNNHSTATIKLSDVPAASVQAPQFLFYHSHSRETWSGPGTPSGTITWVGTQLKAALAERGLEGLSSNVDYVSTVKGYRFSKSYTYSLKTVQALVKQHPTIAYFIDIHRDSQKHEYTTVSINKRSYAQLFFIVGRENPNWQKNEAFAQRLHRLLEQTHPGLSRGIWAKTKQNGNGEYNQSISPRSILVEVGGIENTVAEVQRTVHALADALVTVYNEDRKAEGAIEL